MVVVVTHKHLVHVPFDSDVSPIKPTDDWLECCDPKCSVVRVRSEVEAIATDIEGVAAHLGRSQGIDPTTIARRLRESLVPP